MLSPFNQKTPLWCPHENYHVFESLENRHKGVKRLLCSHVASWWQNWVFCFRSIFLLRAMMLILNSSANSTSNYLRNNRIICTLSYDHHNHTARLV
jgi:hypothetical protein